MDGEDDDTHKTVHGLPDVFSCGMNTLHEHVQNTCHS